MPRNGSGTYTLPTGNPVVAGTTIEASWANNTLADVATELTGSLSRSGAGGMTGPLRLDAGTSGVPGLAWGAETTTGFYRAGTNDMRLAVATTDVQQWTASGTAVTGTLSVSGATTLTGAATLTANPTLSGGTANGVLYLNGSKVATSGSALAFTGKDFGLGTASPVDYGAGYVYMTTDGSLGSGVVLRRNGVAMGLLDSSASSFDLFAQGAAPLRFGVANAETMRLTTTGLGLGTASPGATLHVAGSSGSVLIQPTNVASALLNMRHGSVATNNYFRVDSNSSTVFGTSGTDKATLDASGNLGLGVTPSQWLDGGYMDFPGNGFVGNATAFSSNSMFSGLNASYYSGQWRYKASSLAASTFGQVNGAFQWNIAGSGTAGNAITFTQAMTLDASGNWYLGTAALATTATAGFPWIPSCAGVPTGAPTAPYTNAAAMVVDTTNNRLYVRVGSTWRYASLI